MLVQKLSQEKIDLYWNYCIVLFLGAIMTMLPDLAAAAGGGAAADAEPNAIEDGLCNITNLLTGSVGRGIATVGIVFMGIGLFMGKVSWSVALALGMGIAAIFGANSIINLVTGDGDGETCADAAA